MKSFDEILEERKRKKENGGVEYSRYDAAMGNRASKKATEMYESFFNEVSGFYSEAEKDYNSIDYGSDVSGLYNKYASKTSDYKEKAKSLKNYLKNNKGYLDSESYQKMLDNVRSYDDFLTDTFSAFGDRKDFYTTFETKYDYDAYILNNVGGTDGKSIEARRSAYDSITKRLADIEKEMQESGYNDYYANAYGDLEEDEKYVSLSKERDKLNAELTKYERDGGKLTDEMYTQYSGNDDWEEKSSNRDLGNSTMDEYDEFDTKAYGGYIGYYDGSPSTKVEGMFDYSVSPEDAMKHMGVELSINDPVGFYINNFGRYAEDDESSYYSPNSRIAGVEHSEILMQGDKSHWENLNEDELKIYYYLLNDQGKDSAMAFVKGLENELSHRESDELNKHLEEAGFLEMAFHNAVSVPANIVGGVGAFVDDAINLAMGNDINPYEGGHAIQNYAQGVRSATANDINRLTGASDSDFLTWGDAYQGIMSGIDSAVGAMAFGGGYTVLMGMGGAASEAKELYEKGASREQMIAGGILAGAAEAAFESVSIGYFLDDVLGKPSKNVAQWFMKTLGQAGVEASEELCTTIANYVSDAAVMGSQSDWQAIIDQNKKQGLNDGQAIWQAIKQVGGEALHDAAVGAISGGAMGGVGGAVSGLQYDSAAKAYGKQIINDRGVDNLKALALDMAGEQKGVKNLVNKGTLKEYSKYASKADLTTKKGAKAVGVLADTVDSVTAKQNKADLVKALQEKGIEKSKAKKYVDTLFEMNGGNSSSLTLGTKEQWKKLTGDENAYDVLQNILTDEKSSVNTRNYQHRLALQGLKMTEDGKITLADHNQQKVNELLKKSFDKQSDSIEAKVAEDGKAKVVSTDTEVTLNGIDHIETKKNDDGKKVNVAYLNVVDADGNKSVVEWGDVEFGSRNDAIMYETFVGMDISPSYFDAFVKNFNEADYDASIGEAAIQYATGFNHAFRYGWANMETEMNEDMFASKLTESVRNIAYTLGKESIESKIEAEQKSLDTAVSERKESGKGKARTQGKLHMDDTIKTKPKKNFTKAQNAGIGLAKRLTSIGYDVYLFESHKDENGNWVDENGNEADNGFYRASDGSIHVDINAGRSDVSLMVYTLSHELVHSMRQYSPREFKVLADLLYKWYGKKGVGINELVERKMDELDCDWDTAYEEVIADSCESFLTDSNIADRIVELQETDKDAWEIFRDKVLKFLKWMKSLFTNVDPDSAEGRFVRQYKDEIDHLYDAFYNALSSASENMQWVGSIAEAKTNAETLATAGITVDADTGSAVMNSVRYAPKTQAEIDKVAKALSESMGVSIEKAKAWVKSETSLTSIILDPSNAMFLDYEADDRYDAIKKNGDYPQGTVDFSNLCKKRREFTALLDKLQKEHPNRIITAAEMEHIRQILIEEDVEVACGLCYVEERRQLLGEIAQGFIDGYKNGTLKESIAKELDAKDSYVPTIYDLITYDGYRALTTEHPSIAKAFQKFNNARGMQAGRLIEGIAEYKRDILNWTQKKVDFVNSVGGLRVFSFSDFEATHLIDLVQVIQDCAAKGVMIQAYTKVPAFANAVKDTNMKVNRSLIAKGTGIKYENGRMVLDLDPVEGIDINDKDFFDSTNSKNVGNVLVGMSNEQIRLAMKTPFVDYIIPFHTGLKGDILKAKKIDHWDNYKNFQTDKEYHPEKVSYNKDGSVKSDGWVVAEKQINVYVDVIQAAEAEGKPIKNKVDFVNKFLAVAKEKGLKPRFWNFLDVDANGEYTYTEGYHKFLVDFKLFDQDGNILPQEPVVPQFDDALNARILNDYVAGKKAPVSRDAVYDRLVNEVINGGVKKSSRKTGNSAEKVYNEKNTTKEGLIRGETRQETREAFHRRAARDALQVETSGKTAYGYRRTSASDVTERSRQAEEELKKLGIPAVVYDILEVNQGGVTSVVTSEATTAQGNAVYINNALVLDPKEMAGHEAYHFWKPNYERTVYTDILEDNIIFSSNEFASFASEIEDGYSIGDAEVGSKQMEKLMEEVRAYISGFIHSGNNLDRVMPFIRDFSEVESAWNALASSHSQDVKKSSRKYSKRQKAPIFYSYMGVVVDGVKQEKLGAASVINMLKGKGVKDEEIKWSGIEAWLDGKKSVTKAELQEFIAGSQLQIGEIARQTNYEAYEELNKLWENYFYKHLVSSFNLDSGSFDGMKVKVELAYMEENGFDMPPQDVQDRMVELADSFGIPSKWDEYTFNGRTNYRELVFTMPNSTYSNDAMKAHWGNDAEGILAHARVQDIDVNGQKMLFVEELQSDWHNEGHKSGYANAPDNATVNNTSVKVVDGRYVLHYHNAPLDKSISVEFAEQRQYTKERIHKSLCNGFNRDLELGEKVPDAPFKDTYHEYVLKRLIRMAAEGGYDSIGWTTAQIQSDRWSDAYAEGYRIEYDQDIPKFLRKYGKKWGAEVGKEKIKSDEVTKESQIESRALEILEEKGIVQFHWNWSHEYGLAYEQAKNEIEQQGSFVEIWSMPITDSMKDSVLYEGQVMYQRRGTGTSTRSILANAMESTIDTKTQDGQNELRILNEYKNMVGTLDEWNAKLNELRAQIKTEAFSKGGDRSKVKKLQDEATKLANRISIYDKRLLTLEASKPLKAVLDREKAKSAKRQQQKDAEVLQAYRDRADAKLKKQAEYYRESREKAVERVRESKAKTEAKAKLQKLVLDTAKWISYPKKDDVKCPDIIRAPYADFLQSIDFSSKTLLETGEQTRNDLRIASAMDSLATAIERITAAQNPSTDTDSVLDSGYLDLPPHYVEYLREMAEKTKSYIIEGDYVINRMSSDDIKQLTKLIRTLNHSIREMSTLYSNLRFAKVEELGDNSISFMDELGELDSTNMASDFVSWDNALPYYAFKRFGESGESVFEELMDAQDKLAFLANEIIKFREKAWNDKESKDWSEDTHTINLPSGKTLTLTTADAMSIYCLSRRDNNQGLNHLVGGGVRVLGQEKGSKKAKDSEANLDLNDVVAICNSLTDRQKAVAQAIQEYMSSTCSEWGNEISMKRFLTKDFTEKRYFPIQSNDEVLPTKDPQAQQSDLFRLLNISATKPLTKGANNSVIIRNIFDVFTEHTSDMARLNAYGMALLDYMKWINYKEKTANDKGQIKVRGVHSSMNKAYGSKAFSYAIGLVKDINGRFNDGGDHPILMKMTRAAKTASVGSSLRVAALQFTAYPRAAMVLSTANLAKGLSKKPQISNAKQYCGVALWKSFGFYDTNIARSIEDQIKGTKDWKNKLIELSLKGAEWGDSITWGYLWNACEYDVANSNKQLKVGSEEFNQAVGKRLREVVYSTQVVDSVLTRSSLMRNKSGLTQTATAFMSEPTLTANILMDAGFQFYLEKRRTGSAKLAWNKTGKHITKTVTVFGATSVLVALVESIIDAYRDDDDEEFINKFGKAMLQNTVSDLLIFNKIPILSDIMEGVLSWFGLGYFSTDRLDSVWLADIVKAGNSWIKVLGEAFGVKDTSLTVYKALYDTVKAISSSTGVAYSGLLREIVTLWNNTVGAIDPELKIKKYDN